MSDPTSGLPVPQHVFDTLVTRITQRSAFMGSPMGPASAGVDDVHEELGAVWLAERFGPEVSEPVRLHVAAKRYLCTVEPDYSGKLSDDSNTSLKLQGGLMSPDEVAAFRANPWHAEAVRLRRFDEAAKDPRASTPDFDHYLRHVASCQRT